MSAKTHSTFSQADIETSRRLLTNRYRKQLAEREALRQTALDAVRRLAPAIIARYPSVQAAYLFGSILHPGRFRPDSDIDIGVSGATAEEYFALWHALEEAFPEWNIDLRDLPPSTTFTHRVLTTGEKIYG